MGIGFLSGVRPSLCSLESMEKENPFYHTARWRQTRERALRRDRYQCQECKRYGRVRQATTVHHIIFLEDCPEKAYDLTNLVSLCATCHNRKHPEKASNRSSRYGF